MMLPRWGFLLLYAIIDFPYLSRMEKSALCTFSLSFSLMNLLCQRDATETNSERRKDGKIGIVQQANSYSHEMLAREKKEARETFL
jgi:hypothetical protein